MAFHSILFEKSDDTPRPETIEVPPFFGDLNLDQVVDAITKEFRDYELKPFYFARLRDLDAIRYRQEIMHDLDDKIAMQAVKSFSAKIRLMRGYLKQSQEFHYYKHTVTRRFLAAVDMYCDAVQCLSQDFATFDAESRGLRALREYLSEYIASTSFQSLVAETENLHTDLAAINYSLLLNEGSINVRNYSGEIDYTAGVEETFAKFRHGAADKHGVDVPRWSGMNHIESQVQDRVALLNPEVFASLEAFFSAHTEYLDGKIAAFEREVQFYVAYLTHIEQFRNVGLTFCEPRLSPTSKDIVGRETFDLALAAKLIKEKRPVVRNDFLLHGSERILVISGPNQGGKTTLARTFGQMHYIASLGCLVPGDEARLFLFDQLFTHFERAEDPSNLRGKLQDDLVRIRQILDMASPNSVIVMNEIFSSTTVRDAVYLSKKVMGRMSALDLIGVCVTFLDELASLNEKTVSMVSTIDSGNPAIRTYKLERRLADGLAYALAIAEKYRVTYQWISKRVNG